MNNKIVLITGAAGGLGSALVAEVAKKNPKKIYCGVRDLSSAEFLKNISSAVELLELDISKSDSIKSAISAIENLDVLINNAGINKGGRVIDGDFSEIEVNLFGTMNLTSALFSKLTHKEAVVINVTSSLALINLPIMACYCISKAALRSYTQALRAELSFYGARVFEALSGPIDTRLSAGADMPKAKPSDVAKAIIDGINGSSYDIYTDDYAKELKAALDENYAIVERDMSYSLKG